MSAQRTYTESNMSNATRVQRSPDQLGFGRSKLRLHTRSTTRSAHWHVLLHHVLAEVFDVPSMFCGVTTFHAACVLSWKSAIPSLPGASGSLSLIGGAELDSRNVVVADRGLHDRGSFTRELLSNGTYLGQTVVEASEQRGRPERQGGIFMSLRTIIIKHRPVVGRNSRRSA